MRFDERGFWCCGGVLFAGKRHSRRLICYEHHRIGIEFAERQHQRSAVETPAFYGVGEVGLPAAVV